MKKLFLFPLLMMTVIACSQSHSEKFCPTYEELPDPHKSGSGWENIKPDLNYSFGSIDERYAKHVAPEFKENRKYWEGVAWKGERISSQLILWTTEDVKQVEFEVSGLKSGKNLIPDSCIQPHFVRYTMTDEFGKGCGYRKPENFAASLSADVLDNIECMDMEANSVRPVWITIDIPRDIEAGIYKGKVTLFAKIGGKSWKKDLNLQVEVLNKTLTSSSEWPFYLDLWQHPASIARWHNVPLWSDEHFNLLRPLMKRLAGAGQKVITTNLNKDPWNGQCYDRYGDMIMWTKKTGGTWSYNYTAFDKWVNMMMEVGINKVINCYSMVPWNNELHYWDEAKNGTVTVQAIPGTPIFEAIWLPFLSDFKEHLKAKSWIDITNIAMDERDPKTMKVVIGFLQKNAPELGIALADNHKSYKEYPFLKDISIAHGATVEPEDMKYRKENGLITTYYVCCSDKFPNAFTFSAPAESAFAIWFAAASGFDGFLRWAYNSWVENPLLDSRFRTWPAGDTNIVYPENRSSIRFERLMQGVQDVEKLRILREELSGSNDNMNKAKLDKIDDLLQRISKLPEPEEPCNKLVERASKLMNDLVR
ncbi:MAG: DUF4091 domain-containing protein [Dysgonamonadaceae bacterium]|jgi:hypothetical protein|nr:DUF4091 domain-containing protein [Dysgonamonadaceae bacterium]